MEDALLLGNEALRIVEHVVAAVQAAPHRDQPFAPNSGYAFAVGDDTYHSVDTVGSEVRTRDSILLTCFLDDTSLDRVKNRVKRVANLVRNEFRSMIR